MKPIIICDTTLKNLTRKSLSFRKKLDIAALLDSMKIPVIELGDIAATTEDRLLIKSVASSIQDSTLSVCVGFNRALIGPSWEGLQTARKKRFQVKASLSTARMEYVYHKKAQEMLPILSEAVSECRKYCDDVEFLADDATRADFAFLKSVISEVIKAGATTITVSDSAGTMLPWEFEAFLKTLSAEIPELSDVSLGVELNNTLGLADALAVSALKSGATEIKASACDADTVSLAVLVKILKAKPEAFPYEFSLPVENIDHQLKVISNLCNLSYDGMSPFENGVREIPENVFFTEKDSLETIMTEIQKLGYTLSDGDREKVYQAFRRIVSKKEKIDLHELEVIVASEAMQVP